MLDLGKWLAGGGDVDKRERQADGHAATHVVLCVSSPLGHNGSKRLHGRKPSTHHNTSDGRHFPATGGRTYVFLQRWCRLWTMLFVSSFLPMSCSFMVRTWAVWQATDSVSSDSVPSSVPAPRIA